MLQDNSVVNETNVFWRVVGLGAFLTQQVENAGGQDSELAVLNELAQVGEARFLAFWVLFNDADDTLNNSSFVVKATLNKVNRSVRKLSRGGQLYFYCYFPKESYRTTKMLWLYFKERGSFKTRVSQNSISPLTLGLPEQSAPCTEENIILFKLSSVRQDNFFFCRQKYAHRSNIRQKYGSFSCQTC